MKIAFAAASALICLLGSTAFAASPGWPARTELLRKAWGLQLADPARPGLWESRKLSSGSERILASIDSFKDGRVQSVEWTAESGVHAKDIDDKEFWAILDGTSLEAEWTETDPDGLPKPFLRTLDVSPSQGFLCRSCKPRLVAATFTRHKATGLRIGLLAESFADLVVGLAPGITEDGLRSLAGQRKLTVDVANPCLDKNGICSMELSGEAGQKWIFRRRDGKAPWTRLEASYQAGIWWSPDWDWDSLRIQSPREFKTVIGEWIGSEADVVGSKLLGPIEPVLAFTVSSWKSRDLPGLRVKQVSDSIAKLDAPPRHLRLAHTRELEFEIDSFGRRIVKIGEAIP